MRQRRKSGLGQEGSLRSRWRHQKASKTTHTSLFGRALLTGGTSGMPPGWETSPGLSEPPYIPPPPTPSSMPPCII